MCTYGGRLFKTFASLRWHAFVLLTIKFQTFNGVNKSLWLPRTEKIISLVEYLGIFLV